MLDKVSLCKNPKREPISAPFLGTLCGEIFGSSGKNVLAMRGIFDCRVAAETMNKLWTHLGQKE